jgi:hypothetical protein
MPDPDRFRILSSGASTEGNMMSDTRFYVGQRNPDNEFDTDVCVEEGDRRRALPSVGTHSDSFDWGYGGSAPAQLAQSILADHLCDPARAQELHQRFKAQVVFYLPKEGFRIPRERVAQWCSQQTTDQ